MCSSESTRTAPSPSNSKQGVARRGRARRGLARPGAARRGVAGPGAAGQGTARQGVFSNSNQGAHRLMATTTISRKSDTRLEIVERNVTVEGIRPIMFDRYAGDNDTKLTWQEKIYLIPNDNVLCLPTININSFFTAHNTNSAPKRLRDKRKYKDICNAIQSFCMIEAEDGTDYCPFVRDGEPIRVGTFEESVEPKSGLYLHRSVARLDKGIPNPKERPTLPLPWSLSFVLKILPNQAIKEAEIKNLLKEGGLAIGFGTYRGQFGKFLVTRWD